jgi:H+/Cl- antiporter ClcA
MGFLKTPGLSIKKFTNNITSSMGQGISDIFITPLGGVTGIATGAFSDVTSSPLLYVMMAGLVIVVFQGMKSTESVSNTALNNPESLRALADAMK